MLLYLVDQGADWFIVVLFTNFLKESLKDLGFTEYSTSWSYHIWIIIERLSLNISTPILRHHTSLRIHSD